LSCLRSGSRDAGLIGLQLGTVIGCWQVATCPWVVGQIAAATAALAMMALSSSVRSRKTWKKAFTNDVRDPKPLAR